MTMFCINRSRNDYVDFMWFYSNEIIYQELNTNWNFDVIIMFSYLPAMLTLFR